MKNTRTVRRKFLERYTLRMSLIPDTVLLPSTSALGSAPKLSLTNTMSATPLAAPEPLWSATPTLAIFSDLTSFTPSPTMATYLPSDLRVAMMSSL